MIAKQSHCRILSRGGTVGEGRCHIKEADRLYHHTPGGAFSRTPTFCEDSQPSGGNLQIVKEQKV
jgi:hypothetical protein